MSIARRPRAAAVPCPTIVALMDPKAERTALSAERAAVS
jgi:hypothetical protein